MSLHMSPEQLYERTGFKQKAKQRAELARQGVKFTTRQDGYPLVLLSQFDAGKPAKRKEPDFDAANRMTA